MISSASATRRALAGAALATVAALAAACGTASTSTVTVVAGAGSSSPAAGGSSSAPAPPSTPAGPAECATSVLRLGLGRGSAAAGTSYVNIDFTNTGGSACFLQGYPGVSLVSAGSDAGSQIGADAKRDPTAPSRLVTLEPGQTAHALFAIEAAGNFPPTTCHIVIAHWLKVFPPDQFTAAYISFTTQTCSQTSQPTMRIQRIQPGA
jgi:hypothetical protein